MTMTFIESNIGQYSAEFPTKPGYYWLKSGEVEEIVEVWVDPDHPGKALWIHRCGDGNCCALESVQEGMWAGPIPRPER
jgi:hypothetical protein